MYHWNLSGASRSGDAQAFKPGIPNPGGASEAAPPTYSLDQIINQMHTSWGGSHEGITRGWDKVNITYSMPDTAPSNDPDLPVHGEASGQVAMTALMKAQARLAFELWDDLVPLNLTESANNPAADITLTYSTNTGGTYATPILEAPVNNNENFIANQIWADATWTSQDEDADMFFGGYGFQTYLHEIGHTLGLSHPGTYNGSADYATDAEFAQDNRQFTIMSYFGGYSPSHQAWSQDTDGTEGTWLYSSTPMLYDIAAIQAKYGADYTTRSGNTTYGFNSNAGRDVYDFNLNDHPIFTIWDGGGTDTIDTHFYYDSQYINLGEGAYSSMLGLTGNIAIAYGAVIENAKGGSGQDYIQGNAANNNLCGNGDSDQLYGMSGNDRLDGGQGADQMFGGGGDDTYYVDNINDYIEETTLINGHDKVYSSTSSYTLPYKVEVLTLLNGAVSGTGNAGANEINGNTGDNVLNGGGGADILRGGQGADTYYVDDIGDQVLESSTPEIDTVHSTISYVLSGYVENLVLEGGAIYGTGNTLDNLITGNGFYNELYGDAGNDILAGGAGIDELWGGSDQDAASYAGASAAIIASLGNASINTGDAEGDVYFDVENLIGSSFNDFVFGDHAVNSISAGDGADVIKGYRGNDILAGGNGKDTFVFNSTLDSSANVDTIVDYSVAADTIDLDNAFFTALTTLGTLAASAFKDIVGGPKDANDRIIYNSDTGNLYYDADGSGAAFGNVKFAVLTGLPDLTAADFVVI
ncbi:M10 family metallopeptidase C-terminal domain-containing protein [Mesorhizobium yinganensis]|uniref:M10 family metallopeptidase C-terminal domain-containing protein n=1 Tax=Mesorhizobium yinganensis TaxID=3157707 RepID=UPI0032B7184C